MAVNIGDTLELVGDYSDNPGWDEVTPLQVKIIDMIVPVGESVKILVAEMESFFTYRTPPNHSQTPNKSLTGKWLTLHLRHVEASWNEDEGVVHVHLHSHRPRYSNPNLDDEHMLWVTGATSYKKL